LPDPWMSKDEQAVPTVQTPSAEMTQLLAWTRLCLTTRGTNNLYSHIHIANR